MAVFKIGVGKLNAEAFVLLLEENKRLGREFDGFECNIKEKETYAVFKG